MRPSKNLYYLGIALAVAQRGTCLRRNYGAIIVKDDMIVSTGYTGAPRGMDNCCVIGKCLREEQDVPSGERYDLCKSVHAEVNAIIHAGRDKCLDADMYLACTDPTFDKFPCYLCRRIVINSGLKRISIPFGISNASSLSRDGIIEMEDQYYESLKNK